MDPALLSVCTVGRKNPNGNVATEPRRVGRARGEDQEPVLGSGSVSSGLWTLSREESDAEDRQESRVVQWRGSESKGRLSHTTTGRQVRRPLR